MEAATVASKPPPTATQTTIQQQKQQQQQQQQDTPSTSPTPTPGPVVPENLISVAPLHEKTVPVIPTQLPLPDDGEEDEDSEEEGDTKESLRAKLAMLVSTMCGPVIDLVQIFIHNS